MNYDKNEVIFSNTNMNFSFNKVVSVESEQFAGDALNKAVIALDQYYKFEFLNQDDNPNHAIEALLRELKLDLSKKEALISFLQSYIDPFNFFEEEEKHIDFRFDENELTLLNYVLSLHAQRSAEKLLEKAPINHENEKLQAMSKSVSKAPAVERGNYLYGLTILLLLINLPNAKASAAEYAGSANTLLCTNNGNHPHEFIPINTTLPSGVTYGPSLVLQLSTVARRIGHLYDWPGGNATANLDNRVVQAQVIPYPGDTHKTMSVKELEEAIKQISKSVLKKLFSLGILDQIDDNYTPHWLLLDAEKGKSPFTFTKKCWQIF